MFSVTDVCRSTWEVCSILVITVVLDAPPEKREFEYYTAQDTPSWIGLAIAPFPGPGEYSPKEKSSNSNGLRNEDGPSTRTPILPFRDTSTWAYAVYGLVALIFLYSIRRLEINRQQLQHLAELEHVKVEQLRKLDRLKARFFANISHEFRTPLMLIQGPIQQLLCREFTGDVKQQYRCILKNCCRLLFLVNQLLDLSRLEADQERLQVRPMNIVSLTRQLVMVFESLAAMRNIQLKFEAPEPSIIAYLDQAIYEKIITNLVSNAIKFTPDGGVVIVECRVRNAQVEEKSDFQPSPALPGVPDSEILEFVSIRIKDTGIGIAEDNLPHIFDRFYRIDNTFQEEEKGTGIGLALTKELVTLHHGEITVTSKPGKGSTFVVHLPLGKEHLGAEEIVDSPVEVLELSKKTLADISLLVPEFLELSTEDKATNGKLAEKSAIPNPQSETILIVEDNADMRAYLRSLLEGNYRILEAQNGKEGLQCARNRQPDLILSDLMMPQMDGFQLCEKVKADAHISHIPVILLTAKAIHQSKLQGLQIGVDEYLIKPFDAVELKLRVKNILAQRRQLRERFRRELKVEPQGITITSADEAFLKQAIEIVENHMGNEHFDTTQFAKQIGMSRSQLNVKLRALTGCSTREFIRALRLKRAAQLLEQGFGNVAQVAYEVGFNNLSYFAKVFKEQFGVLPSQFPARGTADAHAHTP